MNNTISRPRRGPSMLMLLAFTFLIAGVILMFTVVVVGVGIAVLVAGVVFAIVAWLKHRRNARQA